MAAQHVVERPNRAPRLVRFTAWRFARGYDSPMPASHSWSASAPLLPLIRVAVAWMFVTAATLVGPCRPPAAAPALAAEATP